MQLACSNPGTEAPIEDTDKSELRSVLFPENWQPGFSDDQGRSLPDVSYSGYRNGERAPDFDALTVVPVVFSQNVIAGGDATAELQAVIDQVSVEGGSVEIPKCTGNLVGRLQGAPSKVF